METDCWLLQPNIHIPFLQGIYTKNLLLSIVLFSSTFLFLPSDEFLESIMLIKVDVTFSKLVR